MAEKEPFSLPRFTRQSDVTTQGEIAAEGQPQAPHKPCPQCGSEIVFKDGWRYDTALPVQRYLCRDCGYRFSDPNVKVNVVSKLIEPFKSGSDLAEGSVTNVNSTVKKVSQCSAFSSSEDVGSHIVTILGKGLNSYRSYNSNHRVCASQEAKNLEATTETIVAGEQTETKGKIVGYIWHLQKQGRTKDTCYNYMHKLETMLKEGANLLDPEAVKDYLAKKKTWTDSTKFFTVAVYDGFLKYLGVTWQKPQYKFNQKLPFIPSESELDSLIANTGKGMSAMLQLLKETAMRPGEALRLKWTDVDAERRIVVLNNPEKNSNPRIWNVSPLLVQKLSDLPKRNENVLGNIHRSSVEQNFATQRRRISLRLGNPRLQQITFKTFRHWKATMEYHKTRDILHTMQFLGHKNIKNTLIYTQLIKFKESDEFHSAVAKTTKEAKNLIETGFEYVCTTPEQLMIFRKRK